MGAPTKANVDELFRIDQDFAKQAAKEAAKEFDDVRTWVDPRGYRLSDRIWSSREGVRRQIDLVLQDAVANRTDALTVAKQLEQYLNPEYAVLRSSTGAILKGQRSGIITKTPGRGGAGSFSARRLARTEISRAHAQATNRSARLTPFCIGWEWNLSASHPGTDVCDRHATTDVGLGKGIYPSDQGPTMPGHPHCLCYSTLVTVDDDQLILRTLRSEYGLPDTGFDAPLEFDPLPDDLPLKPKFKNRASVEEWFRKAGVPDARMTRNKGVTQKNLRQIEKDAQEYVRLRRAGMPTPQSVIYDDEVIRLYQDDATRAAARPFGQAPVPSATPPTPGPVTIDVAQRNADELRRRILAAEAEDGEILLSDIMDNVAGDFDYTLWKPNGVVIDNIQGRVENAALRWNDKPNTFPLMDVPLDLSKITASQNAANKGLLLDLAEDFDPSKARALVVKFGDEYLIVDGHHTILAGVLDGQQSLRLHVFDLTSTADDAVKSIFKTESALYRAYANKEITTQEFVLEAQKFQEARIAKRAVKNLGEVPDFKSYDDVELWWDQAGVTTALHGEIEDLPTFLRIAKEQAEYARFYRAQGFELPDTISYEQMGPRVQGLAQINAGRINLKLNTSAMSPRGQDILTQVSETQFATAPDSLYTFVHELGHATHMREILKRFPEGTDAVDYFERIAKTKFTFDEANVVGRQVSRYAMDTPAEFVAEVWAGTSYGITYSDEVLAIYRKFDGPSFASPVRSPRLSVFQKQEAQRLLDEAKAAKAEAAKAAEIAKDEAKARVEDRWRPLMSRNDAEEWVKDSVLKETFYHGTAKTAAEGIMSTGFDLSKSSWGRVWGNGVYVTPSRSLAREYAKFAEVLRVKVNVKKVLEIDMTDFDNIELLQQFNQPKIFARAITSNRDEQAKILKLWMDEVDASKARQIARVDEQNALLSSDPRWAELQKEIRAFHPVGDAIEAVLKEYDYDAISIKSIDQIDNVGGTQIMVRNPKHVTVFDDTVPDLPKALADELEALPDSLAVQSVDDAVAKAAADDLAEKTEEIMGPPSVPKEVDDFLAFDRLPEDQQIQFSRMWKLQYEPGYFLDRFEAGDLWDFPDVTRETILTYKKAFETSKRVDFPDTFPTMGDKPTKLGKEIAEKARKDQNDVEWIKSQLSQDWNPDFNKTRPRDFLKDYTQGIGYSVSADLRGTLSVSRARYSAQQIQDYVDEMDYYISKSTINQDVIAYRGVASEDFRQQMLSAKPGDVFMDKGYQSTSVDRFEINRFSFGSRVPDGPQMLQTQIYLNVPKGSNGIYLGRRSLYPEQAELLLPRNGGMVIREVVVDATGHVKVYADYVAPDMSDVKEFIPRKPAKKVKTEVTRAELDALDNAVLNETENSLLFTPDGAIDLVPKSNTPTGGVYKTEKAFFKDSTWFVPKDTPESITRFDFSWNGTFDIMVDYDVKVARFVQQDGRILTVTRPPGGWPSREALDELNAELSRKYKDALDATRVSTDLSTNVWARVDRTTELWIPEYASRFGIKFEYTTLEAIQSRTGTAFLKIQGQIDDVGEQIVDEIDDRIMDQVEDAIAGKMIVREISDEVKVIMKGDDLPYGQGEVLDRMLEKQYQAGIDVDISLVDFVREAEPQTIELFREIQAIIRKGDDTLPTFGGTQARRAGADLSKRADNYKKGLKQRKAQLESEWPDLFNQDRPFDFMTDYTRGAAYSVSNDLRGLPPIEAVKYTADEIKDYVAEMDYYLSQSTFEKGFVGFRGQASEELRQKLIAAKPGDVYIDEGYASVSLDRDQAERFFYGTRPGKEATVDQIMFVMDIPAGTNGVYFGTKSEFEEVTELLLPRRGTMVIKEVVVKSNGQLTVYVDYVGPDMSDVPRFVPKKPVPKVKHVTSDEQALLKSIEDDPPSQATLYGPDGVAETTVKGPWGVGLPLRTMTPFYKDSVMVVPNGAFSFSKEVVAAELYRVLDADLKIARYYLDDKIVTLTRPTNGWPSGSDVYEARRKIRRDLEETPKFSELRNQVYIGEFNFFKFDRMLEQATFEEIVKQFNIGYDVIPL